MLILNLVFLGNEPFTGKSLSQKELKIFTIGFCASIRWWKLGEGRDVGMEELLCTYMWDWSYFILCAQHANNSQFCSLFFGFLSHCWVLLAMISSPNPIPPSASRVPVVIGEGWGGRGSSNPPHQAINPNINHFAAFGQTFRIHTGGPWPGSLF